MIGKLSSLRGFKWVEIPGNFFGFFVDFPGFRLL